MQVPRLRSSVPSRSTADRRRQSTSRSMRSIGLAALLAAAPPTGWALAASTSSVLGMYRSQDRPGTDRSSLQQQMGDPGTTGLGNPGAGGNETPLPPSDPGASAPRPKVGPAPGTELSSSESEDPMTEPTPDPEPQEPVTEPEPDQTEEPESNPTGGGGQLGQQIEQQPEEPVSDPGRAASTPAPVSGGGVS